MQVMQDRDAAAASEAIALAQKAAKERWDAYYKAHPEKLKAKLEREARKGTRPRGRPSREKQKIG